MKDAEAIEEATTFTRCEHVPENVAATLEEAARGVLGHVRCTKCDFVVTMLRPNEEELSELRTRVREKLNVNGSSVLKS